MLLSRRVRPPLSLGLFGDWGSGKSFFMAKLQDQINRAASGADRQEIETQEPSEWCSRVVQIEFNAWHFSDANLWASLVTRIYDALYDALGSKEATDEELRRQLEAEVRRAKGAVHQAEVQQQAAEDRVRTAAEALKRAREAASAKQDRLRNLIGNIATLLQGRPDTKAQLDAATEALGVPEAAATYEALEALHTDLRSLSQRTNAVAVSAVRAPRLGLAAALLLGLPLVIGIVLHVFDDAIGQVGQVVGGLSSFVLGLLAWMGAQVKRGLGLIQQVEGGLTAVREERAPHPRAHAAIGVGQRPRERGVVNRM